MNTKNVMDRIEELAKEKHISLCALMENADLSTTIYQWRKTKNREAKRMPSLNSLEKICNYLGITLSYFFAEKDEKLGIRQTEIANKLKDMDESDLELLERIIEVMQRGKNQ